MISMLKHLSVVIYHYLYIFCNGFSIICNLDNAVCASSLKLTAIEFFAKISIDENKENIFLTFFDLELKQ